jgi:hypothetical protein
VAVTERGYGEAYPQQVGNDRRNEHAGKCRHAQLLRLVKDDTAAHLSPARPDFPVAIFPGHGTFPSIDPKAVNH